MTAIARRLKRLRRIRTELGDLGLSDVAEEVGEEIASLEALPTDNPAVAEFLGAVMDLEKGMNKIEIERRGGTRWD